MISYPIGIPAAPFDPETPLPSPPMSVLLGQATLGWYIVDGVSGTDASNPLGTQSHPRATIPLPIPPGAVVYVARPPINGDWNIQFAGAVNNPAFVAFLSGNLPARSVVIKGNNGYVVGLRSKGMNIFAPTETVTVRDFEVIGDLVGGGVGIVHPQEYNGNPGTIGIHNIMLLRGNVHDCGDVNAGFDQDAHGIAIGQANISDVWVMDCELARCSGDGVQINGTQFGYPVSVSRIYVGNTESFGHKQNGLWTKTAGTVVFSHNTIHNIRPSNSSVGMGMGGQYAPDSLQMLDNTIYDCEFGLGTVGYNTLNGTVIIYANRISNVHYSSPRSDNDPMNPWMAGAGVFMAGGRYKYVINNTIYDVDRGIGLAIGGDINLTNNIMATLAKDTFRFGSALDNNTLAKNMLAEQARLVNPFTGQIVSIPDSTWLASGNLRGVPIFQDLLSLKLTPDSPGHGVGVGGVDVGAYPNG